jgi:DNA-binding NarL/FixJ family response regulator
MWNAEPVEALPVASESDAVENAPESQRRRTWPGAPEAVLWHGLITGSLRLVDARCDSSSCIAVFREQSGAVPKLTSLELLLLCRAFQGEAQKNLAFEFNVSPATISQLLATARSKLGLGDRLALTPLPIVFLALSHCGIAELPAVRSERTQREGHEYLELEWSPFDPSALTELSQGERHVALLVAWGSSYKRIADERNTSTHTVANQIASAGPPPRTSRTAR